MNEDDQLRRHLLTGGGERLDLELKQWLDPTSPEGIAKIARTCIALRNNNGGRLVIGLQDDSSPDHENAPADTRSTFSVDAIQSIVSKYSSEQFAIDVRVAEFDGAQCIVIAVPDGVQTPVAARSTLTGPGGAKPLIEDHAIYVRTIHSNGTASTSKARRDDWPKLTQTCMDNREANIGRFIRRHLGSMSPETIETLSDLLRAHDQVRTEAHDVDSELERFRLRCGAATEGRGRSVPDAGSRESLVLIAGRDNEESRLTSALLKRLLASAPRHSGWPPWADLGRAPDPHFRPYPYERGWEAVLAVGDVPPIPPHFDFWRIEAPAKFYHYSTLEDDLASGHGVTAGTQLDFVLQCGRITEVIAAGLSFARTLGCDSESSLITFAFRWSRLKGRHLTSWTEPGRGMASFGLGAVQDQFTATTTMTPDTAPGSIPGFVRSIVDELFEIFDGTTLSASVIEGISNRTLARHY